MAYQAIADAIINAIKISCKKSFDNKTTIPETLAPRTLRMPISFVFPATTKDINPHKPMQQIKIDIIENALKRL